MIALLPPPLFVFYLVIVSEQQDLFGTYKLYQMNALAPFLGYGALGA
jgi:hypothetical protein